MGEDFRNIRFELNDGVATVTLNRPERLNSFNRDFQRELGKTRDYREGVEAFLTKRAPRFTGN